MGLLETGSQLQQAPGDALLVCFDELWPQYLAAPMGLVAFAAAFVLSNTDAGNYARLSLPRIETQELVLPDDLQRFIQSSPAAAAIPLLQALSSTQTSTTVPLNISSNRWFARLEKPGYENI